MAASNHVGLVDAALLRPGRFDYLIYVPPPNAQVSINPCLCCQVWGSQGMLATNSVALIDAALLRPCRFDHLIYVPPPNAQVSIVFYPQSRTSGKSAKVFTRL